MNKFATNTFFLTAQNEIEEDGTMLRLEIRDGLFHKDLMIPF